MAAQLQERSVICLGPCVSKLIPPHVIQLSSCAAMVTAAAENVTSVRHKIIPNISKKRARLEIYKCQLHAQLEKELEASRQKCSQQESALQLAAAVGAANEKAAKSGTPCVIVWPVQLTTT